MVDDNENGIEVSDEIHGDLLERSGGDTSDRKIRVARWVCVYLVLLTDKTSFHIVGYKDSHS